MRGFVSVIDIRRQVCVDKYFECISKLGIEMPHNMSKAKVKAFLASRPEICPYLGVAALKGYWPFNNDVFNDIKEFLRGL